MPVVPTTQVQPNITFSDTCSRTPIRFNTIPPWVPWANPVVVLLSQYGPLSISCLSAHWALLGWVMPLHFCLPTSHVEAWPRRDLTTSALIPWQPAWVSVVLLRSSRPGLVFMGSTSWGWAGCLAPPYHRLGIFWTSSLLLKS